MFLSYSRASLLESVCFNLRIKILKNNAFGPKSRIESQGSQQKSRNMPFSSAPFLPDRAPILCWPCAGGADDSHRPYDSAARPCSPLVVQFWPFLDQAQSCASQARQCTLCSQILMMKTLGNCSLLPCNPSLIHCMRL